VPSLDKVRVEIDEAGMAALARSAEIREAVHDPAESRVVRPAQARAPKRTGFGASTIHAEMALDVDGWEARVSWSPDAFYLKFHELGTRYMDADPFLVPTEGFVQ
jgi:HK97 gp10 family phage protein